MGKNDGMEALILKNKIKEYPQETGMAFSSEPKHFLLQRGLRIYPARKVLNKHRDNSRLIEVDNSNSSRLIID